MLHPPRLNATLPVCPERKKFFSAAFSASRSGILAVALSAIVVALVL